MWFMKKKAHGEDLLRCPRCRTHMEKIKKDDVIIDVCSRCNGMWLDDNEVEKLVQMSRKGGKHERK